jgi:hypothetical protein
MTLVEPNIQESVESTKENPHQQPLSATPIDRILQRLSVLEFPAKEHLERYMRHKWRLNHKPSTLSGSFNPFSSNTSTRQDSIRRATRSIAFGIPVPPNFSMPGCVWNACSSYWGTRISR